MSNLSQLQDLWETEYESTATPFDIEEPDSWIAVLERIGKIHGNVLDSGCGPGRTSRYLAARGHRVLGIDISRKAIDRAQRKAFEAHSGARFAQGNVCDLFGYDNHFDTVVDIGCFHSLHPDCRGPYAAALYRSCRSGARVYLRAFSDKNPRNWVHPSGRGIPAMSEDQIRNPFSTHGWTVNSLTEKEIDLFISPNEIPKKICWFAELQRA